MNEQIVRFNKKHQLNNDNMNGYFHSYSSSSQTIIKDGKKITKKTVSDNVNGKTKTYTQYLENDKVVKTIKPHKYRLEHQSIQDNYLQSQ